MSSRKQQSKSLFLAALEMDSCGERNAFVDQQCSGDLELRVAVMELLSHEKRLDGFMEVQATDEPVATLVSSTKHQEAIVSCESRGGSCSATTRSRN